MIKHHDLLFLPDYSRTALNLTLIFSRSNSKASISSFRYISPSLHTIKTKVGFLIHSKSKYFYLCEVRKSSRPSMWTSRIWRLASKKYIIPIPSSLRNIFTTNLSASQGTESSHRIHRPSGRRSDSTSRSRTWLPTVSGWSDRTSASLHQSPR